MLSAIASSRRRVWLEMYWFEADAVGVRFRDALGEASRRGVDIRVMIDAFGSFGTPLNFFAPLTLGHELLVYNPLANWQRGLSRLTRRDHRKLLIADDVGFTGGFNIASVWAPEDESAEPWRDDGVRMEGPAVDELAKAFGRVWQETELRTKYPALATLDEDARASAFQTQQANVPDSARVAVLPQTRATHRRLAFAAYLDRVRRAKRSIWIANAYFLPNRLMTRALRDATRRGVDLRVVVPGISDVEIVRHGSRAVWGRLLHAGARIYEWQPSILHSKTAVVDGEWATLGSFNLDYRSIRSNLELNVSVLDPAFAKAVEDSFLADLEQCIEVDRRAFMFRSLGDRLLERVAYWFRSWL